MSQFAGLTQSQLGMTVQGCWQALALVHVKHCERPDTLENVPELQQLHEDWPTTGLKEPGAHGEQRYEPMMEWDPTGHTVRMFTVLRAEIEPSAQRISNQQLREQHTSSIPHTPPSPHTTPCNH